jgi:hypothetical protein
MAIRIDEWWIDKFWLIEKVDNEVLQRIKSGYKIKNPTKRVGRC